MNANPAMLKFSVIIPTYNRVERLKLCLDGVLSQTTPRDQYEVIVVNDGSSDGTEEFLLQAERERGIRHIVLTDLGIATARNRGAEVARGEILAFVDDDCLVPPTWLQTIERSLRERRAALVFGNVENKLADNSFSVVHDEMNQYLLSRLNTDEYKPGFVLTTSFGCTREFFLRSGGFDERFYFGSEDREYVARLLTAGERVVFDPTIVVGHQHSFTPRSFLSYFHKLGKGSHLLYNVANNEKRLGLTPLSPGVIIDMLLQVGRGNGFFARLQKMTLAVVAQLFILIGYLGGKLEGVSDLRHDTSGVNKSSLVGSKGTMLGLFSFLGGTAFSSAFGFFSFVIVGRALSIPEYGVFMVAFSLESLLSSLGNLGLHQSVVRFASEFSKHNDEDNASSVLKTGLALQTTLVLVLVIVGLPIAGPMVTSVLKVPLSPSLLIAVLVGAVGSIFYNYVATVYSIYLRFIDLTVLRAVVSITRFLAIACLALLSLGTVDNLFWAFILPHWLGFAIAFFEYKRKTAGKGKARLDYVRRILAYGGWGTATSIARLVTTHLGALILATYATEHEVGRWGLGQTLSFVYSVVSMTLTQYFMPIGARVKSDEDIIPFIRQTLRLALPLVVASLLSLALAHPLVSLMYGPSRVVAVPVFVLISLSIVLGTGFVSVNVLFHYFFKPHYITLETVLRSVIFLSGALALAGSAGATGVAAAYCLAGITAQAVAFALLAREFKKRGIALELNMWRTFGFSEKRHSYPLNNAAKDEPNV